MPAAISLNALRAFEASARHLSFTRAADELCVTQAAVSHQVKALEERIGADLFRRTTRGLVLTDEGQALAPALTESFERMLRVVSAFEGGRGREVLTVGAVGTFAVSWLLPRLSDFNARYPLIDLRLLTNNNKVDLAGESLDYAIRFGDGAWHGVDAEPLLPAPLSPLCTPSTAERLRKVDDLALVPLLRSYRPQDWPAWLAAAGAPSIAARGPLFDSSYVMVRAAMQGNGVALAPPSMFERELGEGSLVQPFALSIDGGRYWLTRLIAKPPTTAMSAFRDWLFDQARAQTTRSAPAPKKALPGPAKRKRAAAAR
jgi:LysR family transcriptional regulator, regulator of gene expression of beta-lactamase